MAEILINNNAEANHIYDENGKSPLTLAAWNGNLELIEFFLLQGCNINHLDTNHRVPIFYALAQNHKDAVKFLVQQGADQTNIYYTYKQKVNENGVCVNERKRKRAYEGEFETLPSSIYDIHLDFSTQFDM